MRLACDHVHNWQCEATLYLITTTSARTTISAPHAMGVGWFGGSLKRLTKTPACLRRTCAQAAMTGTPSIPLCCVLPYIYIRTSQHSFPIVLVR